MRPLLLSLLAVSIGSAADLPRVPAKSIAVQKELLFSDDFQGGEPAKFWHKVVPTFTVENGVLKTLPQHVTVHELAISPPVLWEEQRERIGVGEETLAE